MKTTATVFTVGLIALAVLFSLASVDAQNASSRELRELGWFTAIDVGGGIDVEIRQGEEYLAEISSSENDLSDVITEIDGSSLSVRFGTGAGRFFGIFPADADVIITTPVLEAVSASGGSDVDSIGTISGDALSIAASGGADVRMTVNVTSVSVVTSGGSDVDLSGSAQTAVFKTSGGSDLNARSLNVRDVQVQTSGGSDVDLAVSGRLTGNVSGGSDVYYIGDPEDVDVRVSGGGELSGG